MDRRKKERKRKKKNVELKKKVQDNIDQGDKEDTPAESFIIAVLCYLNSRRPHKMCAAVWLILNTDYC